MRFACTFTNGTREILVHMLTGLSKLNEVSICCLLLKDLSGLELRGVGDYSSAFGKLDVSTFTSYRVQSKANNIISMELSITSLLSALKSVDNSAEEASFKLTKNSKTGAICFNLTTLTITQILITQEVPILRILPLQDMVKYSEPNIGKADATLVFPDCRVVKTVLERMKQLDKFVQIKMDQKNGNLVFRVDTEVVSVRTIFNQLQLENDDNNNNNDDDMEEEEEEEGKKQQKKRNRNQYVVASLSSKELYSITSSLSGFGKRVNNTVLAIVKNSAVCLHISFDDESHLTFYLGTRVGEDGGEEEEYNNQNNIHHQKLENNQLLRFETVMEEE